ncbi:MAG: peptidase dimerization domain-containing protein, partial [Sediminibacterium sp.]
AEKEAIARMPQADEQMKKELGFIMPEMEGVSLQESLMLPSLNINGIQSANAGKLAANVIPATAHATLDLRLVKGNDYQVQQQRVVDHIKAQGYFVTDKEPTVDERKKYPKIARVIKHDGYNAQRTSMELPIAKEIVEAVRTTTKEPVVIVPSLGGSLPLYKFEKYLKANTISVPIANHDNNQHAENENIRIRNLWDGIETMASIMLMK